MQPSILGACPKPRYIARVTTGSVSGIKIVAMMEVGAPIIHMRWCLTLYLPLAPQNPEDSMYHPVGTPT